MPRPVRKRITTAKPAAAAPSPAKPTAASSRSTREKADSPPSDRIFSDSDEIVRKLQRGPRKYEPAFSHNHLMTGALGPADEPSAHRFLDAQSVTLQRIRSELRTEDAAKKAARSARRKSTAAAKKGKTQIDTPPVSTSKAKEPRASAGGETVFTPQGTGKLRRRISAISRSGAAEPLSDIAPGSIVRNRESRAVDRVKDSFTATETTGKRTSLNTIAPSSIQRAVATPSFQSMVDFKRRPRQHSLLHDVQKAARDRDTDVEDNGISEDGDGPSLMTLGGLSADVSPQANGRTPSVHSSSSRKRKRGEVGEINSPQPAPGSSPPVKPHTASRSVDSVEVEHSQPAQDQVPLPTRDSADPENELAERVQVTDKATRQMRPKRRKQSPREMSPVNATSPLSSPLSSPPPLSPSETSAPEQKHRIRKSKDRSTSSAPLSKPIKQGKKDIQQSTTDRLQAMLPKRRQGPSQRLRARDEFEILWSSPAERDESPASASEHDDSDSDELARRSRRRRATQTVPKRHPSGKSVRPSKLSKTPARGKLGIAKAASAGARRTYTRAREASAAEPSDGEDEVRIPAATGKTAKQIKAEERKTSAELKEASEKFAEVDDWHLEYESADIGAGGSSSPWR